LTREAVDLVLPGGVPAALARPGRQRTVGLPDGLVPGAPHDHPGFVPAGPGTTAMARLRRCYRRGNGREFLVAPGLARVACRTPAHLSEAPARSPRHCLDRLRGSGRRDL